MGEEKSAAWYDSINWAGYDTSIYQPIYKVVLEMLKRIKPEEILEIGCGEGNLGHQIIEKVQKRYIGIDFSEKAIEAAKRKYPMNFGVANAYHPTQYRPFDCVIAMEVLEHLDDIRVMKLIPPGCHVIFSVPAFDSEGHIRTYVDVERDIYQRFDDYLEYLGYLEFKLPQTIHLIEARRHEQNRG